MERSHNKQCVESEKQSFQTKGKAEKYYSQFARGLLCDLFYALTLNSLAFFSITFEQKLNSCFLLRKTS